MARPLDLDKLKKAWNLRRQGSRQKDIARLLHLSLRHTQNYLSLDWPARRSLRSLTKGAVEEVNDQLKTLWSLGQTGGPRKSSEQDGAFSNGHLVICEYSGLWPDVSLLEGWGIPKATAPGMLGAWRRAHREEAHGVCGFWAGLSENVQTGMPFTDAYDLSTACCFSDYEETDTIRDISEIFRLYRPWEGKTNRLVYLAEVRHTLESRLNGSTSDDLATAVYGLPRRFIVGNFKCEGEADQDLE